MVKILDNNDSIESTEGMDCFVVFGTRLETGKSITINFTIDTPKSIYHGVPSELRAYLETEGSKILSTMLSLKYSKMEWELEEFD
jgi:hypothetical protein